MLPRKIWALFLIAFILDVIRSSTVPSEDFAENEEGTSTKKAKKKRTYINLRIEFCQSWSHRGYFNQVKDYLEKTFSNISVTPDDYPLSTTRQYLYYTVIFVQMSLILLAICGKYIKPYVMVYIPERYVDLIEENKIVFGIGAFMGGNILMNYITNTGAFEIYCNEKLIWSAIENDLRVPNLDSIINLIRKTGLKLSRK